MDDILAGFQPVNVAKGPMTMTVSYSGVSFSKAAVQTLGNPEYVRFLINETTKQAAVQVSTKDRADSISFYKASRKTGDARWNYNSLRVSLSDLMDWDLKEHTYRAEGHYNRANNLLMFELTSATRLR